MGKLKKEIFDWVYLMGMIFLLLFASMWVVYYIVENYVDVDSIFGGNLDEKKVYVLNGDEKFIQNSVKNEYKVEIIDDKKLSKLNSKSVLVVFDKVLSKDEQFLIEKFVKNGGGVIFNYGNYKNTQFIKRITNLNDMLILKDKNFYIQTPSLSPFKVPKQKLTHFYENSLFYYEDKNSILNFIKDYKSYGVMWSGNYGKGSWVYFSFPFYVLNENHLSKLFLSMIDFAYYGYKVVKYPYVDSAKMIFLAEYMNYKMDKTFINLINKFNLKATLFINPDIVNEKLNFNNIEIASISSKNKWILQKYTKEQIVGFSNENHKENIDILYNKYGFKYMLGDKLKIYYDDFVELPNIGFNDLEFKINLKQLKHQIDFSMKYGFYSLIVHPYILGYTKNQKFLVEILTYLKKYPLFTAKEIAQKYKDSSKISLTSTLTSSSLAIKIINNTLKEVNNFTFRIYSKFKFDKIESNFFNIKAKIIKRGKGYVDVRVENISKNVEFYIRMKK